MRRPAAVAKVKYLERGREKEGGGGRERERERGRGRERRENIVGDRYIHTYFLETSTWTPF